MSDRIPHLVWLDDDLFEDRRSYVKPWLKWFEAQINGGKIRLTLCPTLEELTLAFKRSEASDPVDDRIDLLAVDVMIKRSRNPHFGALGFPNEKILRLEAGVQLVGLLRNAAHREERAPWLRCHSETPALLLSSSPLVAGLVSHHIDGNRREGVTVVSKTLNPGNSEEAVVDELFRKGMQAAIDQFRR